VIGLAGLQASPSPPPDPPLTVAPFRCYSRSGVEVFVQQWHLRAQPIEDEGIRLLFDEAGAAAGIARQDARIDLSDLL